MIKVVVLLMALVPSLSFGYTVEQEYLLDMAQHIGQEEVGMPETIQSILLVETAAGAAGRVGDRGRSIGVMQVRPETADYVVMLNQHKLRKLRSYYHYAIALMNDEYSMVVGALYFKRCMDVYRSWRRAVVCYNQGVAGAGRLSDKEINQHVYLKKVKRALKNVRKYRKKVAQRRSLASTGSGAGFRQDSRLLEIQSEAANNTVLCDVVSLLHDGQGNHERRYVQRSVCSPRRNLYRGPFYLQ